MSLKQNLTLYGLVMIAIGASIGSGIFRTPGKIAALLHDPNLILGIWVVGGLIALTGALTLSELGAMFPKAGGIYVYIREAFGERVAFLCGWANLLIMNTGSMAGLAMTFATYFHTVAGGDERLIAMILIVIVTVVNIVGVKSGEIFSSVFTTLKIIGIAIIVCLGLFYALPHGTTKGFEASSVASQGFAAALAAALAGVFWSYGGWQHTSYLSGEAKNPMRNVPLAMVIGASVTTVLYLLVNYAYLQLLPLDDFAASKAVATDAVKTVWASGGTVIAVVIMCSVFGTLGIYAMSLPRVYFAMAEDGLFFKQMGYIHPTYRTPIVSILVQSGWSLVLLLFMDFEKLLNYVEFMDWVFMFLAGLSVFVFRYQRPNAARPVRTFLYPVTPFIFCSIVLWFLVMTLRGKDSWMQATAGLVILALGLPIYEYFKWMKNKESSAN